jgi:hypothetical protein
MSETSVRRLFVAVFLGLILQYGLVGIVGAIASEPWPAIVLPGFKSVYDNGEEFIFDEPEIQVVFEDQSASPVRAPTFLREMPGSHHAVFLSQQCRPASMSGTDDTERCLREGNRAWFLSRAREIFPERSVQGVRVVWSKMRFDPATDAQPRRTPLDTLRID